MEDYTITITPAMAALVPVVAAILQVLKRMEAVQKMTEWLLTDHRPGRIRRV